MTCGACHPEAFRPEGGGRVFGYLVGRDPSDIADAARKLMYLGAEHVYADIPHGNVRYRKGLLRICKVMRPGDRLILASDKTLGRDNRTSEARKAEIEALGVEVFFIRAGFFD